MIEEIKKQAAAVTAEICEKAKLRKGQILVVGCSSSEVCGDKIGKQFLLLNMSMLFLSQKLAVLLQQLLIRPSPIQ